MGEIWEETLSGPHGVDNGQGNKIVHVSQVAPVPRISCISLNMYALITLYDNTRASYYDQDYGISSDYYLWQVNH